MNELIKQTIKGKKAQGCCHIEIKKTSTEHEKLKFNYYFHSKHFSLFKSLRHGVSVVRISCEEFNFFEKKLHGTFSDERINWNS